MPRIYLCNPSIELLSTLPGSREIVGLQKKSVITVIADLIGLFGDSFSPANPLCADGGDGIQGLRFRVGQHLDCPVEQANDKNF